VCACRAASVLQQTSASSTTPQASCGLFRPTQRSSTAPAASQPPQHTAGPVISCELGRSAQGGICAAGTRACARRIDPTAGCACGRRPKRSRRRAERAAAGARPRPRAAAGAARPRPTTSPSPRAASCRRWGWASGLGTPMMIDVFTCGLKHCCPCLAECIGLHHMYWSLW